LGSPYSIHKFANGSDFPDDLKGKSLFDFLFNPQSYTPRTIEELMQEVEHCMTFEGLEERLVKRAIYQKESEIRMAHAELERAKEEKSWKVEYFERLLQWAKNLEAPEE
jgi:hypothetical protein